MISSFNANLENKIDASSFQNSCQASKAMFRELKHDELIAVDEEESINKSISTWSRDISLLPNISHNFIKKYLVNDTIHIDNCKKGANKHQTLGYRLFKENYVKNVCVKANVTASINLFIVKSNVAASMKRKQYEVFIHLCQSTGEILYSKCHCKAGAGGCCKHVAASLYQLVDYKELDIKVVPETETCTDVLQIWHVPGESSNSEAILFSNLNFEKADAFKDKNSTRKRPLVSGTRRYHSLPNCYETSTLQLQTLCKGLENLCQGTYISSIIRDNNFQACSFFNSSLSTFIDNDIAEPFSKKDDRLIIITLFDNLKKVIDLSCLSTEQKAFVELHLIVDIEEAKNIEVNTVKQSESTLWYQERCKRLTASNFGTVINRWKKIYPTSILKKCLQTKNIKAGENCMWGKVNEDIAIKLYENITKSSVTRCGFFINPKCPWLGCSPDGVVSAEKVLEVKCPSSKKHLTIKEACQDKNFYLKFNDGAPKLKINHPYYYQCQGVMALTETKTIDFIVYTEKSLHIETIEYDAELWNTIIFPELTDFYFKFMSSEIFKVK
jgi:hypothetical protein